MNNNDDWVEDVNFTPFKFYEFVEQVWAKARKFRYSYEKIYKTMWGKTEQDDFTDSILLLSRAINHLKFIKKSMIRDERIRKHKNAKTWKLYPSKEEKTLGGSYRSL